MKKFLSVIIAVVAVCLLPQSISAQTCVISGTNGDTVEVFDAILDNNQVKVTLSNDSQYAANIKVWVEVTYIGSNSLYTKTTSRSYDDWCLAKPMATTIAPVKIETEFVEGGYTYKVSNFKVTRLEGRKCVK